MILQKIILNLFYFIINNLHLNTLTLFHCSYPYTFITIVFLIWKFQQCKITIDAKINIINCFYRRDFRFFLDKAPVNRLFSNSLTKKRMSEFQRNSTPTLPMEHSNKHRYNFRKHLACHKRKDFKSFSIFRSNSRSVEF